MKEIFLFTMSGCEDCDLIKKTLRRESIEFEDLDISTNSQVWDEIVNVTNQNTVPTIFVKEGGVEGKVYLPNIDFNSAEELLKILI